MLGADVEGLRPWLAMTYVPGPTLAAHVQLQGPIRQPNLDALGVGLADALAAIHRAGVIHRAAPLC